MLARPQLSFEFFPPATEAGRERLLRETLPALQPLGPEFFSCTYGAGGSTRDATFGIVSAIHRAGLEVAPHLSFGADDTATVGALLDAYQEQGIKRLVALRGDSPSGTGGSGLAHAGKLVEFARKRHGAHFRIAVAAYPEVHPQASDYGSDVHFLKAKLDAGADFAITQYFYNTDAYFHFIEQCAAAGITKPIYAGIMPITNYTQLARFSRFCGAEIPRWICRRLESFGGDTDSLREFGIEVVTRLAETLLDQGCPGLHFYTMNQLGPSRSIVRKLNLKPAG